MNEAQRQQLNEINRELMVANADYEDLKKRWEKRLTRISKKIFKLKTEIDNLLNGE